MSRIYTDYLNETVIPIPDKFINVKTGESQVITPRVQNQLAYHAQNNTLIHLVLSALDDYFHPKIPRNFGAKEILMELHEIKDMLQNGNNMKQLPLDVVSKKNLPHPDELNIQDIEDLLEAFGG